MERQETFFRDLCENAHDLIQSVSPEGRFLYVNRAWLETLGYEEGDLADITVFDVIHPDSRDHCAQVMRELLSGHEPVLFEADFITKSGRRVSVEGSASCRFENGRAVSTRGIFRDVSDRLQAREELNQLFNLSLDLLCIGGTDGRFKRVNPAFYVNLGYEAHEIVGRSYIELIHPEDREKTVDELEQLAAGRVVVDFENRFRTKYGNYRWLAWRATPIPDQGLVFAVGRDITEQKKLQEAREEIDRLFHVSLDMMCIAGLDGFFKRVNPAFKAVLGYDDQELLSRQFIEFVHPDDRVDTLKQVERLAEGLPVVDFRNRYLAKDGSWRWLAWRSVARKGSGLIYATARDITEQMAFDDLMKRKSEELERSNADLERFASAASHDLLAPLRRLSQLAAWIEEDLPAERPEGVSRHMSNMREQIVRMETLVGDLLRYSRATKSTGGDERVDTADLVRGIRELLAPPESFSIVAEPPMPVFETAKAPLEQVLRNLIGNAIKHHRGTEGRVVVTARDVGSSYEFAVEDDGPGIPEMYHRKVFEMFQKLRPREEVEGSGIGLPLVRRIVERYGGRISLDSEEGRGATFRFTWPKTTPKSAHSASGTEVEVKRAQDPDR